MVDGNPYEAAAAVLIRESGCTVRSYRANISGGAYTKEDDWGIEVPRPRGPISFGAFAHEVGHQLKHRYNSLPRWREEVEAEEFALQCFDRFGLEGRERYEKNVVLHLDKAFYKAIRRSSRLVTVISETYPEWWRLAGDTNRWIARFMREEVEHAVQGHLYR